MKNDIFTRGKNIAFYIFPDQTFLSWGNILQFGEKKWVTLVLSQTDQLVLDHPLLEYQHSQFPR